MTLEEKKNADLALTLGELGETFGYSRGWLAARGFTKANFPHGVTPSKFVAWLDAEIDAGFVRLAKAVVQAPTSPAIEAADRSARFENIFHVLRSSNARRGAFGIQVAHPPGLTASPQSRGNNES